MRNVLITGGAGFIGSNFVRYWLANHPGDRVVNLDALTYAGNLESLKDIESNPNYRFIHGNVCDVDCIEKVFEDEKIDTVVNFAAESHVDRSILGPEVFIKTNIHGTFTLLEAARKFWDKDKTGCRFLHVSTDEVYGSLGPEDPAFTEQTPFAPNSPYSASKAASDHLARAYYHTYDLPVLTTNCSNNYGPYQFPEKLIPLVIINALEGKPLPIYGDGMNIRDWLHVEDHCRGIDVVLDKGCLGETYNIGGCNEWANIDIVKLVCEHLDELRPGNAPKSNLITYIKDRLGHDRRYAIDAGKMKRELDWEPLYTFEKGIEETILWYLDNKEWWARVRDGAYRDYYNRQYR
ncbi:dTDP-glucose 4,6-dehydratase [Thiogranum longum]|uniref:dTDP-glucose 4,6-dehydratase n=1 Tax=Thiogranum longum TaxID=1537524 RepID=A0A4R1HQ89_9GAMM|nr:dTDP-glucose 4,6-dehydratase [Thiogranum longum]TCK19482.1 dTDP-glucose 4,6-dehydratase [Thiogranum longum]